MSVGSSTGEHFEDVLHSQVGRFFVDNQQSVKDPEGTQDQNIVTPQQIEDSKRINADPKNIYDDQGNIVDYDFWGTGPRKLPDNQSPETQPRSGYDTPLSPLEESVFQHWKQRVAPNDSGEDYDLRGAFKAGAEPSENGHMPDTWKKPNHPTFSDQSKYYKYSPSSAGSWKGEEFSGPNMIHPIANLTNTPDEIMAGLEGVRNSMNKGVAGPTQRERVGKAALRTDSGEVFEGHNHGDAFEKFQAKYPNETNFLNVDQGFTTSSGRFINRDEAFTLAKQMDQFKDKGIAPLKAFGLLSEDLK